MWIDGGLFERERKFYEELISRGAVDEVFWYTYGVGDCELAESLYLKNELDRRIKIIEMAGIFNNKVGMFLYSFLMPFIRQQELKKTDLLKTNQVVGSWSAVIAKFIFRKPLIVRTGYTLSYVMRQRGGGKIKFIVSRVIERFAFRNADLGVVSTDYQKQYLIDSDRQIRNKLVVIPNYIDCDRFVSGGQIKKNDRWIFVGRLHQEKNLKSAIEALHLAGQKLDVVGEGALKQELSEWVAEKGSDTKFLGGVSNRDLPGILANYKYFILPSYYEGMPKSILEAMSCGLVCLGTDVAGINELIVHGENGYLSAGTDVENLANAVENVVACEGEAVAARAAGYVRDNFSLDMVLGLESEVYHSALNT